MLELRECRIRITVPSCSLMTVKITSILSPDGCTAKLNGELSSELVLIQAFVRPKFPLILG